LKQLNEQDKQLAIDKLTQLKDEEMTNSKQIWESKINQLLNEVSLN
jgi:hypothetical protein